MDSNYPRHQVSTNKHTTFSLTSGTSGLCLTQSTPSHMVLNQIKGNYGSGWDEKEGSNVAGLPLLSLLHGRVIVLFNRPPVSQQQHGVSSVSHVSWSKNQRVSGMVGCSQVSWFRDTSSDSDLFLSLWPQQNEGPRLDYLGIYLKRLSV